MRSRRDARRRRRQQSGEVGTAKLKLFVQHNREVTGMFADPALDAVDVVGTVVRVLDDKGDFKSLFQFALIHHAAKEFGRRFAQEQNGA